MRAFRVGDLKALGGMAFESSMDKGKQNVLARSMLADRLWDEGDGVEVVVESE